VNQQPSKNPDELGALWKKKTKDGAEYLSGFITLPGFPKLSISIFYDANPKNPKAPVVKILQSGQPVQQQEQRPQTQQQPEDLTPPADLEARIPF
jgi:hypothetical protein